MIRHTSDTIPERLSKTSIYTWEYAWDIKEEEIEVPVEQTSQPEEITEPEESELAEPQEISVGMEYEVIDNDNNTYEPPVYDKIKEGEVPQLQFTEETNSSSIWKREMVKKTVYTYNSVLVNEPITSNKVISAVISATMDVNYEQKLINEYNEVIINKDKSEEGERKKQKYSDWLTLRSKLKADCEEVCAEHNIE